jgi:hypothetical protein
LSQPHCIKVTLTFSLDRRKELQEVGATVASSVYSSLIWIRQWKSLKIKRCEIHLQ